MAISEIGVSHPDDTFRQGTPDTPPEIVRWIGSAPLLHYVIHLLLSHIHANITITIISSSSITIIFTLNLQSQPVPRFFVVFFTSHFSACQVEGKPWMFVLRDVLQYARTLTEALHAIQTSNRTCNLIIGVGDGKPQLPQLPPPSESDVQVRNLVCSPGHCFYHGSCHDVMRN